MLAQKHKTNPLTLYGIYMYNKNENTPAASTLQWHDTIEEINVDSKAEYTA